MKKLLTFIMLILTISMFSQIDYPRYQIDSLGQKVVVITIEQAKKLDNNSDLLILLKKERAQMQNYDNVCVKVISDKEVVIQKMTIQVSKLEEDMCIKDDKIKILQNEIFSWESRSKILENEILNKDSVIAEKNKEISKLKGKMLLGGLGGGLIIIGLVLTSIGIIH